MRPFATVVGARPNFMKMAPVIEALRARGAPQVFVHTGQHYDAQMSEVFFTELGMPKPDVYMGVGSGSHAEQTAKVMVGFEKLLLEHQIGRVVVAGDVNSTMACAIAAAKLNVPVAHVESGLRSFDRAMPEELNRIVTDRISDLLFVTEPSGLTHLASEGITRGVHHVGNTMIDSVRRHQRAAVARAPWTRFGLAEGSYGVVTLHRPSNVDVADTATPIVRVLAAVARELPLVFPIHPRTLARSGAMFSSIPGVTVTEPLGYLEFLGLVARARAVLTDSGGIQEETTALGVNCVTLRENTERPITVEVGTNTLCAPDADAVLALVRRGPRDGARVPELWDGHAADRIADVLLA